LGRASDFYREAVTHRRVTLVGLALAAYMAEFGEFPSALADLVPKRLEAVPTDALTGGDLIYRREGAGCVLYSLGLNLRDDGGRSGEDGEGFDDIVIRLK